MDPPDILKIKVFEDFFKFEEKNATGPAESIYSLMRTLGNSASVVGKKVSVP